LSLPWAGTKLTAVKTISTSGWRIVASGGAIQRLSGRPSTNQAQIGRHSEMLHPCRLEDPSASRSLLAKMELGGSNEEKSAMEPL
jgi:hypothetical protein